jgi:hypothetical protein
MGGANKRVEAWGTNDIPSFLLACLQVHHKHSPSLSPPFAFGSRWCLGGLRGSRGRDAVGLFELAREARGPFAGSRVTIRYVDYEVGSAAPLK